MKNKKLKRLVASVAACAMMISAVPVVPATAGAASNLIKNSTFDSNTSGWDIYKESGGVCSLGTENGKLAMHVEKQGTLAYACQLNYDIIPLYQNGVYRLSFEISSSIPRVVEAMIQLNGGDYHSYTWKKIEVTEEPQVVDFQFTMKDETDIMSKMCFNCGIEEEDGELPPHTVYLDNVVLELVDDSKVDYAASKPYAPDIITNQVGFRKADVKKAVFRNTEGGEFQIVNAETKSAVYTGTISAPSADALSGDMAGVADFSDFGETGKYYITAEGLDDSYAFEIGDDVYSDLFDDSIRMLYLQRCGCEVKDEKFGHPSCHDTEATIYHTNQKIDVSGGWHDAGDYGRYVVPAAKAVADLMYAYLDSPEMFSDNIGIPESGNGTPDVLDEVRYELEWMMKMQDKSDGGVYHKVSCATFPGFIMPEQETGALIVMPKTVTSSADFAASMALAAEVYKDVDSDFADKCLDAARDAFAWAKANPNELYLKNPDDISTGAYEDKSAADEMYWAACQLYRLTNDTAYLQSAEKTAKGLDWSLVGDYGNIALATMNTSATPVVTPETPLEAGNIRSEVYDNARTAILEQADEFVEASDKSAYGVALKKFNWGSNMTVANAGIILSYAFRLTGDEKYIKAAEDQLNYLLGCNANGASFFTGYGTVSPEHPHHRPSIAQGEAMKGMLVGGVDQMLEDSAAKAYCADNTPAKCWVDHDQSYSTNEITIYWNSPLTYLIALTKNKPTADPPVIEKDKWGDANSDGEVSVADAAAILQYLGNAEAFPLSEEGKKLADVCNSGDGITPKDAIAIQKYSAGLIPSLPESIK